MCASVVFHCLFQMDEPASTPQRVALDATPPACFPVGKGEQEGEYTDEEEEEEYNQWGELRMTAQHVTGRKISLIFKQIMIKAFGSFHQEAKNLHKTPFIYIFGHTLFIYFLIKLDHHGSICLLNSKQRKSR